MSQPQQTTNLAPFAHFGTDAIHAGQEPDKYSGAVITPISLSSTFAQVSPGVHYPGHYEYARTANPTRDAFESCVAALENGKFACAFSSGLGCTTTLLNLLSAGDHVISVDDVYGGTGRYFRQVAGKFGLEFSFIDLNVEEEFKQTVRSQTKLIWLETPTNPTLRITDIERVHKWRLQYCPEAMLIVDNTFMSPYFQRPLDFGADVVMHSVTKYLNGHSDVVMGVCATANEEIYKKIKYLQNAMGAIPSPFDSFLALRGLKTLHVRMRQHQVGAIAVADFLKDHPKVAKLTYPGLESHPQHDIALKQMTGFGGMITFWIKGDITQARQFLENLKIFQLAESLGGVESLVNHPVIMTHASVPVELRKKLGIDDTLIRLSCGIEDVADLISDLETAFSHVTL